MTILFAIAAALAVQALIALLLNMIERRFPARAADPKRGTQNYGIGAALIFANALARSWLGPVVTLVIGACGGGFFRLPTGSYWVAGFAIYLVLMDLGEYLFHRAQHALPVLWSMHSLHHSDPDFGAATAARHFWLEPWIKSVTIWLAIGALLRADASIVSAYAVVSFYHYFVHANLKFDLGRASWLINTPAYHRLHHSAEPEHFHCNFASLFPVFDVISGTYRPAKGVYPPTGLDTGEYPASVVTALQWPIRGLLSNAARLRLAMRAAK